MKEIFQMHQHTKIDKNLLISSVHRTPVEKSASCIEALCLTGCETSHPTRDKPEMNLKSKENKVETVADIPYWLSSMCVLECFM